MADECSHTSAIKKVTPSVVQIVTQGGADMVVTTPKGPVFRKALGPTTGVIVTADGYIISSAFNFLNSPTTILVAIQGRAEPLVAKKVATDQSRMLTLLKVDAEMVLTKYQTGIDCDKRGYSAFVVSGQPVAKVTVAKGAYEQQGC